MRTLNLSLLLLAGLACACSAPRLDLTPRFGSFDVGGSLGVSSTGAVAEADLASAGLQKDDSVLGARLDFDWGGSHLQVSAQSSAHGGDGVLTASLSEAGGPGIPAGTPVSSTLDLGLYTASYTFDVVPTDLVEVGLGLGVNVFDVSTSFTDRTNGNVIDAEQILPLPVLAARIGTRFWLIDASLQAEGVAVSYSGASLRYFDLDLMAKLHLLGGDEHLAGHLTAGYRWIELSLDFEDGSDHVASGLSFDGPYIGVTLSI